MGEGRRINVGRACGCDGGVLGRRRKDVCWVGGKDRFCNCRGLCLRMGGLRLGLGLNGYGSRKVFECRRGRRAIVGRHGRIVHRCRSANARTWASLRDPIPRGRHWGRERRRVCLYGQPLWVIDIFGTPRRIEDWEGKGLGRCRWRAGDTEKETGARHSRAQGAGARRTRTTASQTADRACKAAAGTHTALAGRSDDCDLVFFHG